MRESCFNCNFKLGNKYSDITLGDFWGVQEYYPKMYNKQGVSAIIINTENGQKIFKDISDNLNYKECKLNEIVSGNPSLEKSSVIPKNRKIFFEELDNTSINDLSKKYCKKNSIFKKVNSKLKGIKKKIVKKLK